MQFASTLIDRLVPRLLRLRNRHFFVLDVVVLLCTPVLALMLRMERVEVVQIYAPSLVVLTVVFLGIKLVLFRKVGLYNRYWKYASIDELAKITFAVVSAMLVQYAVFLFVLRPLGVVDPAFPRSVPFIESMLAMIMVGGTRYSVRLAQRMQQRLRPEDTAGRRVLVVGAGAAGIMMVQEMRGNPQLGLLPAAFVDDDADKQGMRIRGLDVLGGHEQIPDFVQGHAIDLIIIAIPRASGKAVRQIAEVCRRTGVETKTVPGVYELLDDTVSISQLRDVQVEDLLRRAPVPTSRGKVAHLVQGRRVLVTGAGGSIGSELCRQIMKLGPAELLLLGHGENSIFNIEAELRQRAKALGGPAPRLISIIADVRDRPRMAQVFGLYAPQIVFHAAAHKHVPLMEANIEDAVTNNVLGTRNLLELVEEGAVEQFVLISTDKAVNPTNIMGATKRIAELLVRDAASRTGKAVQAVRFGNVLGSRGSVLQIFRQQIARGGPLTVTHPDVQRYFMTIPEAVYLVLQAASMGTGGEVFVLDMGEPVRIVDLARDLIRLSGMTEGQDIDIIFTGMRPGEKMDETLFGDGEHFDYTEHGKILACQQNGEGAADWTAAEREEMRWDVEALLTAAREGETERAVTLIRRLVPTYQPVDQGVPGRTFTLAEERSEA